MVVHNLVNGDFLVLKLCIIHVDLQSFVMFRNIIEQENNRYPTWCTGYNVPGINFFNDKSYTSTCKNDINKYAVLINIFVHKRPHDLPDHMQYIYYIFWK